MAGGLAIRRARLRDDEAGVTNKLPVSSASAGICWASKDDGSCPAAVAVTELDAGPTSTTRSKSAILTSKWWPRVNQGQTLARHETGEAGAPLERAMACVAFFPHLSMSLVFFGS